MTTVQLVIQLTYLLSAVLFIVGLKRLSSPATARGGNALAATAMLLAVVVTLLDEQIVSFEWIVGGLAVGGLIGVLMARLVKMTAMPQMVAVFNGFGGLASGLVAAAEFLSAYGSGALVTLDASISIMAGTLIGAVTFSGSLVAFGKLQGVVTEKPVLYPAQQFVNGLIFAAILGVMVWLIVGGGVLAGLAPDGLYLGLWLGAMLLGVLLVIPIGGADMPVVVSLLNSYSGLAASAAGFVLGNNVLIISGALVGASGLILTRIMCRAMNRSLANVVFGAFGQAPDAGAGGATGEVRTKADVNSASADDVAMLLAYANKVVIVPGYGLAVAQAQHKLRELADHLQARGVQVRYAIHPVAGRMPGHMNVLLAEANVPYTQLYEVEDINPDMPSVDACLVVGANDTVNPAARDEPGSPIAGMPIVEADRAKHTVVLKRSLSPGFAGIDNELFYKRNTMMLFGDAADTIGELVEEVKAL